MINKIKESNNKRRQLKGYKEGDKVLYKIKEFMDEVGFIGIVLCISVFSTICVALSIFF